jgi:hypothetical protein
MESAAERRPNAPPRAIEGRCGRPGCICSLPIGERFVLWAVRQWQQDSAIPREGTTLHGGFKTAALLDALPDFAIAMDAYLFGARRGLCIHLPSCSCMSIDEAMLVALCALAQGGHEHRLQASLDRLVVPTAVRVAADHFTRFALALQRAGLHLAASHGEPGSSLN